MFYVRSQDTPGGMEIWLHQREPDTCSRLFIYLFATGGIVTPEEIRRLGERLEADHLGRPERPAELLHVGAECCQMRLHAREDVKAREEIEAQRSELRRFFAELPEAAGAFGSFWGVTFPKIAASLRQHPGYPATIVYFSDAARRRPYEWEEGAFARTLEKHGHTLAEDGHNHVCLVCRESLAEPFFDGEEVTVTDLESFLAERDSAKVEEIRRILIDVLPASGMSMPDPMDLDPAWSPQRSKKSLGKLTLQWFPRDGEEPPAPGRLCVFPGVSGEDLRTLNLRET